VPGAKLVEGGHMVVPGGASARADDASAGQCDTGGVVTIDTRPAWLEERRLDRVKDLHRTILLPEADVFAELDDTAPIERRQ
jgi:hypothetical protein